MFSATDIASFLACRHTATLDRAESKDEIVKPFFKDATVDLLRKLGLEHEQRYLRGLAEGATAPKGLLTCVIERRSVTKSRLPSHVGVSDVTAMRW